MARRLPIITRGRAQGTRRGASFEVPADATFLTFLIELAAAEVADPTLELQWRPMVQMEPGAEFEPLNAWTKWRGGVDGGRPGQTFSLVEGGRDYRGKRVSIEVDIPRELQIEAVFLPDEDHPDQT
jgi:hypothetical protein